MKIHENLHGVRSSCILCFHDSIMQIPLSMLLTRKTSGPSSTCRGSSSNIMSWWACKSKTRINSHINSMHNPDPNTNDTCFHCIWTTFATLPRAKRMTGVPTCDGLDGRDGLDDDDPSDFLRLLPSEDEKDSKRPSIGEVQN